MCLPWSRKWETLKRYEISITDDYDDVTGTKFVLLQRCTHCGKEIVRKYRV